MRYKSVSKLGQLLDRGKKKQQTKTKRERGKKIKARKKNKLKKCQER